MGVGRLHSWCAKIFCNGCKEKSHWIFMSSCVFNQNSKMTTCKLGRCLVRKSAWLVSGTVTSISRWITGCCFQKPYYMNWVRSSPLPLSVFYSMRGGICSKFIIYNSTLWLHAAEMVALRSLYSRGALCGTIITFSLCVHCTPIKTNGKGQRPNIKVIQLARAIGGRVLFYTSALQLGIEFYAKWRGWPRRAAGLD